MGVELWLGWLHNYPLYRNAVRSEETWFFAFSITANISGSTVIARPVVCIESSMLRPLGGKVTYPNAAIVVLT